MHIDELKKSSTGAIENIDHDGQKTRIKDWRNGRSRKDRQAVHALTPYQLLAKKRPLTNTGITQ
ncbi:hypothetical protein SAMN05216332_10893 [Nitrosospira briensis]|nr:hypothetical protein SAMN05216332_10893 [Nitrosospira briensis]